LRMVLAAGFLTSD